MKAAIPVQRSFKRLHPNELPLVIGIAAGVLLLMTGVDIYFHDTFILPSYWCDDPANAGTEICQAFLQENTVTIGGNTITYTGRETYWIGYAIIYGAFAALIGIFRFVLGRNVAASIIYSVTIFVPMISGYEDFLYFSLRSIPLPESMPWLDGGFLGIVNTYITKAPSVVPTTLYVGMALMAAFVATMWKVAFKLKV